ncbi:LIM domain containing protein [Leishmania donovani]|uniref:LIM_domain_containing_protein_-_putative n=3 Tax=Leishmania donovani species complex TaxID=38574 RepID=A0A6L0XNJ7_LEIIN|nr:conserved hypothetical protein [Leishmania infantum JPCM5]XP_003864102.1 hypothetical protein, conserved [Leishmania donovani]CAC9534047.1 LIM_domain_containing_protein_-_putative [Leishmania infantum]AYU82260.1 LIM domain containing protein, putative [Leishmania donovani]TPP53602.1 LIM domain family protein [Leishmania donovani]TPP55422.1 LIM domain family protein [Leishmania donovani]CAJ1992265.1 LIM domain containing protein [Leishmania donovani]|eukprot:XP_001468323.1 conserved hypothetical protein [Leishmania infantum JPCM5]
MEQQGEAEAPPSPTQPTDAPTVKTSSADGASGAPPSAANAPAGTKGINSVLQQVDGPVVATGHAQEDGANAPTAVVRGKASAKAVKREVGSSRVDGTPSAIAASSTSLVFSQGSNKTDNHMPHSTAPVHLGDGVQYSSAIAVGSAHTAAPHQPRLSSSPRYSHSGRQVISDACKRSEPFLRGADGNYSTVYAASGLTVNAQYQTIPEEHAEYRQRNKVNLNYRGPLYVVEDVCVPCNACGGPVDPVRRVPVGSLFFHEGCLQCYLCGRRTGVAGLYMQVDRQAVCSECAGRGYEHWVPRQEVESRGMVYGATRGDVYAAMDAHDRGAAKHRQRRIGSLPITAGGGPSTLNKAIVPGALPPTLSIANVHNRRNTSARSFALMERQQYYTQSDNNVIMALPASAARPPSVTGGRKGSTAPLQYRLTSGRHA